MGKKNNFKERQVGDLQVGLRSGAETEDRRKRTIAYHPVLALTHYGGPENPKKENRGADLGHLEEDLKGVKIQVQLKASPVHLTCWPARRELWTLLVFFILSQAIADRHL